MKNCCTVSQPLGDFETVLFKKIPDSCRYPVKVQARVCLSEAGKGQTVVGTPFSSSWHVKALACRDHSLEGLSMSAFLGLCLAGGQKPPFLKLSLVNLPGIFCIVFDLI